MYKTEIHGGVEWYVNQETGLMIKIGKCSPSGTSKVPALSKKSPVKGESSKSKPSRQRIYRKYRVH